MELVSATADPSFRPRRNLRNLRTEFLPPSRGEVLDDSWSRLRRALFVNSEIQFPDQRLHIHAKRFTGPQQCSHRNRTTGLELLPVLAGKSVQDHVFLRESTLHPQVAQAAP